ncbi:hypothetical protein QUF80_20835 [Desulfococcaceae bacterium HSG8]|nr:hypothetical protein [Desulfococcaceae bacterium HSG8]
MHKLVTGVECEFLAIGTKQIVLLDTGAEWSVAGYEIYQSFSDENVSLGSSLGKKTISSRLGSFEGDLYRIDVCLTANWGESLTIEGTFLFCEDWQGPTVLGFHGFLERIRFAIDPYYEKVGCIYFSEAY